MSVANSPITKNEVSALKWIVICALLSGLLMLIAGIYQDIPNTLHADQSHSQQTWNANSIKSAFDAGRCTPQVDVCDGFEYHHCEIKDGLSIGLVISQAVDGFIRETVTGYAARSSHWENKCQ